MNQNLSQVPSPQEIYKAACDLSTDSAPDMDGFTCHFFKGCWDIIQHDMVEMIHGFFMGDYLHHRVTLTALTLIPKVRKPRSSADYRPISLSTFANKVVSKILATRLILPLVIDEQQFGFVRGRSIHESIALAHEMVADLDRKSDGGNLIFKYDMSKAYNGLEWRFLLCAIRALGFSDVVQDSIYRLISNI